MNAKEKKPSKGFWRDNIEALAFAVIMALVIKQFAFEAYKVPTQSMEPTIIGRDLGGSRLIASRFTYMVREPRRWEIMIFQYPWNRMLNYVKRGVGVGPEWLFVRGGDLYSADFDMKREDALKAAKVVRKPRNIQEGIFDNNNCIPPAKRTVEHFRDYWRHEEGASGTGVQPDFKEEIVKIDGTAKPTRVRFARPAGELSVVGSEENAICNRRFDDWSARAPEIGGFSKMLGMPFPVDSESLVAPKPVGDMRIRFEVNPESAKGKVLFEIRDFSMITPIVVELAVEGSGNKSKLVLGDSTKEFDATVPSDEWTEVAVANYDNLVEVWVDGDVVFEHEYSHDIVPVTQVILNDTQLEPPMFEDLEGADPSYKPGENALFWGFDGGKAQFQEIELARDSYYTESGATDFHIPKDYFLMLGDNSPDSLDGRGWRVSELQYKNNDGEIVTLIGDAEAVTEAPTRPMQNPYDNNTKFLDHLGNIHDLDPSRIVRVKTKREDGTEEMLPSKVRLGNLVPREYIQGRAYLKFFPILQIGPIR